MRQLDLFGFFDDGQGVEHDVLLDRLETYDKEHCFQYDIRLRNYEEDLFYAGLSVAQAKALTVHDFSFSVAKTDKEKDMCISFIKRHEWLGTISQYTTHYFMATYNGIVAGVVLMSMPNAFSKILGDDTRELERLISRGACISWSPKNLASRFLSWCMKWMVANTQYRLFTAYSDPMAKELGSIYQALNFYYLGNGFGTTTRYINPYNGKICSDRFFRQTSAYKRYASELGIEWEREWMTSGRVDFSKIPESVAKALRAKSRETQKNARMITFPSKHKYALVLGRSKAETRMLRKRLEESVRTYPYPKQRGM